MEQRSKGSPCFFLVSLFFFIFFLFYCLPSRPHSNTGEGKKLPLFSVFFFSPTACLSFVFFFSLFFFPSPPFFFLPLLARSLEGLIYSLIYLYLGKIQCINSTMQIPADLQQKNIKRKLKYSDSYSDFQRLASIDQRVVQLLSFLP